MRSNPAKPFRRPARRIGLLLALGLLVGAAWPTAVWAQSAPPPRAEGNLPPGETRSLFDQLILKNGGLPASFSELVALIQAQGAGATPPVSLLIPDGRSLVRAKGSYQYPRIVIGAAAQQPAAAENEFGMLLRNRLFVAYVEQINQLEVLSYNEAAGRFEFQLVDDFGTGAEPKITYARRALCSACHQGGAPIFSVRPWQETSANPAVAARIREALTDGPADSYHGVPVEQPLEMAERFDLLTNNGNHLLVTQRIWLDGCGGVDPDAPQCRRQLLRLALRFAWSPGLFDKGAQTYKDLMALQALLWPATGIDIDDVDLANRDPFGNYGRGEQGWSLMRMLGLGKDDEADKLDSLSKLPAELDPLTARPAQKTLTASSDDGVFGLAQFFTHADIARLKQAADHDLDRLLAALDDPAMATLLDYHPFSRLTTMEALLRGLGVDSLPTRCCEGDGDDLLAVADEPDPLQLAVGSDLEAFRKYCFECHRGTPIARLDFMRGDTEAAVWEDMLSVNSMAAVLDWDHSREGVALMPPRRSLEYLALEEARSAGKDPLKAMVGALEARKSR